MPPRRVLGELVHQLVDKPITRAHRHIFVVASVDVDGTGVRHRKPKQQQYYFDGVVAPVHQVAIEQIRVVERRHPVVSKDVYEIPQLAVQVAHDRDFARLLGIDMDY
jgi:hypothetical protein